MACCLLGMMALGPGIAAFGWLRRFFGGAARATCCSTETPRRQSHGVLAVSVLATMVLASATLANYASDAWQAHQAHLREAAAQVDADLRKLSLQSICGVGPGAGEKVPQKAETVFSYHIAKGRGD